MEISKEEYEQMKRQVEHLKDDVYALMAAIRDIHTTLDRVEGWCEQTIMKYVD